MKIETKYDIGQEVWFKNCKEIFHDNIAQIEINIDCLGAIHIYYDLWGDVTKEEQSLFPTKEELLKSL